MKEAILWRQMENGKVMCIACARRCQIPKGSDGFCFVRHNEGGKLYTKSYGRLDAMQVDPIEKKPFNHFMSGSSVFSIGTSSCNLGCLFCQNPELSKEHRMGGTDISPDRIVDLAIESKSSGVAYTYNEPTLFIEYALDTAKAAHKKGLYNVFVTNGYMTAETVKAMKGLIDAAVVDFKGNGERKFVSKYCAIPSSDPIKEALLEMKKAGIHIEITDLIIPTVGDSLDACNGLTKWAFDNLGQDTPLQFTRFHPDYKVFDYPETPYETLKAHYDLAKRNGLNYVYIGNMPGNPYESTYCPKCGEPVIRRYGLHITEWNLGKNNKCPSCGSKIYLVGKSQQPSRKGSVLSFSSPS
jgi:pyruvate formate lyase activating enzyme